MRKVTPTPSDNEQIGACGCLDQRMRRTAIPDRDGFDGRAEPLCEVPGRDERRRGFRRAVVADHDRAGRPPTVGRSRKVHRGSSVVQDLRGDAPEHGLLDAAEAVASHRHHPGAFRGRGLDETAPRPARDRDGCDVLRMHDLGARALDRLMRLPVELVRLLEGAPSSMDGGRCELEVDRVRQVDCGDEDEAPTVREHDVRLPDRLEARLGPVDAAHDALEHLPGLYSGSHRARGRVAHTGVYVASQAVPRPPSDSRDTPASEA